MHGVDNVNDLGAKLSTCVGLDGFEPVHIGKVKNGLADLKAQRRVHLVDIKQVGARANKRDQGHHNGFTNGVNGRVRNLRKELLKVMVERLTSIR